MNPELELRIDIAVDDMLEAAQAREPEMDFEVLRPYLKDGARDSFHAIIKADDDRCDRAATEHRDWANSEMLLAAE